MAPDWFVESLRKRFPVVDHDIPHDLWDWLMPQMSRLVTHWGYWGKENVPVWDRYPWVDPFNTPAAPEDRRRDWVFRDWLYTEEQQAEIRKRHPELEA